MVYSYNFNYKIINITFLIYYNNTFYFLLNYETFFLYLRLIGYMIKIKHWNSYKKQNNPKLLMTQDSTLGYVAIIKPTLMSLGFSYTSEEIWNGYTPKQEVIEISKERKYNEVVYYVYKHSRGYCSYIEIFYKK